MPMRKRQCKGGDSKDGSEVGTGRQGLERAIIFKDIEQNLFITNGKIRNVSKEIGTLRKRQRKILK